MTINEAIQIVDSLHPNAFSAEDKMRWLSELDGKIKEEIIDNHDGGEDTEFVPYIDENEELLVNEPYAGLYITWLKSRIDFANNEVIRYNNTITTFNAEYTAFRNYYTRTHMPKGKKFRYW